MADAEGSVVCTRCVPGKYQGASGATACSGACERGSFCAEGAGAPLPCSGGTYSGATNLSSAAQCQTTDSGFYAPTGSTQQTPCSPGTVAPSASMSSCLKCEAGKYQAGEGKQACVACERGSYCAEGAAAALPCAAGSYSISTSLTSPGGCTQTAAGYFAPTGGTEQTKCSPGTVQPVAGKGACDKCAAGKYQANEGEQACVACESGSYCTEGAAAALPCAKGSYSISTSLTSASECTETGMGHFAPTGGTEQTKCSPGTVQPVAGKGACDKCAAGTYQTNEGEQACVACEPGSYCPEGASAALPCAEGSYSLSTDLISADSCTATDAGYYASTGSTEQTPCSPGTVAPQPSTGLCGKCDAGTFQEDGGGTACDVCFAGSYCRVGAAAALPCVAGTFSSATGLASPEDCSICPLGAACSTGATEPGTLAWSKRPHRSGPRGYPPHRRHTPSCSGLRPLGLRRAPPLACR